MTAPRYFITTTIPYVNGDPHIGHAEEFAQTDAFGRYHRLRGDDTYVLTGTDENSLKNVQAAEREGIPTEDLVERNSLKFKELADALRFDYDQFIRTSVDPRHVAACQKLWRAVQANGDIYKKHYRGLYCVGCERFYDEDELIDGLCPEHRTPPQPVEEENYFFRLSRYGEALRELIASDRLLVLPDFRKNEVLSFVSRGLEDFSISRSYERARGWGVPVPDDPTQVMYVWFDALTNYISALGYDSETELYRQYWLDNPVRVHALGKGVIRFHAVYWPTMLLSAGVPLPATEFVHGYINIAGGKMSKSLGNVIDPAALVTEYGAEAVRYFLLRGVSPTRDADFADVNHFHDQLRARYTADLANDLGNLVNRVVTLVGRNCDGKVPAAGSRGELERSVEELAARVPMAVAEAMDRYDPQSALAAIWDLVKRTNLYLEETKPWELAKAARAGESASAERLRTSLYTAAETVRLVAALLEPFLPATAPRIREQMGVTETAESWTDRLRWGLLAPDTEVARPEPLFPRLELAAG
ncbi:MAG TPA: methionine--tRNA ligase [Chloroflexota bacterium]|nr:methionine--tRNA ligase [Chloroflexota bacterium]